MTTSYQIASLRSLVEFLSGFRCSVREIKRGSLKGRYKVAPLEVENSLWDIKDDLEALGFELCSAQAAFLPHGDAERVITTNI